MRNTIIIAAAVSLMLTSCAGSLKNPNITNNELVALTSYLSSEKLKGRLTGSEGDSLAARYIRKEMHRAGLEPFSGDGLQRFEVPFSAKAGAANRLEQILHPWHRHQTAPWSQRWHLPVTDSRSTMIQ